MDSALYQKMKQDIVDGCSRCSRKLKALDVLFEQDVIPVGGEAPADDAEPERRATGALTCPFCSNRVRHDNGGCPGCGRKVCREHRRPNGSARAGYCVECAPNVPDGRKRNGSARENSGPAPQGRPKKYGAKGRGGESLLDIKPAADVPCESCGKDPAVIRCAGCAKVICGACARTYNGQCSECSVVPA